MLFNLNINLIFLILINFLFFTGIIGIIFNKRNILIILMSLEIIILSIILNFIFASLLLDDIFGQIFVLYILALGAAESAISLSFFIIYFKKTRTIRLEDFNQIRN